jgi:threonine synthase
LRIQENCYSAWRYAKSFPYVEPSEIVSLGEGWTPLVKFSSTVFFKLESLNPTGSFKDRGSTVLMSAITRSVKDAGLYVSEDSSGNAGASIAAYAARAGLRCKIYVPEAVSGPKFNQIRFYGADVVKVAGNRSRVTEEAQKKENRKTYVGHILHPVFRDGMRTFAYEIAEQFCWKLPERIYLPVSAGTLLLGLLAGLKHLVASGVLKTYPTVVACQTRQVSPLYHCLNGLRYAPPEKVTSVADALVSINPPLLDLMTKELKEADGEAVIVDEKEIIEAFKELALNGFFVEPSSAVAYAGYKKQVQAKQVSRGTTSLIVLTGMGLKSAIQSFG